MVEPLSALLITRFGLVANSLSASLSFLVRLCLVVGFDLTSLISSLVSSKASSSATLGPRIVLLLSGLGLLARNISPFIFGVLGGFIMRMSFLFALFVKALKSFNISIGAALSAVGTKDSPLFSTIVCALDRGVFERLTILFAAQL